MRLLFYDFEVFRYDWMVVIIDFDTKQKLVIVNDTVKLKKIYKKHKDAIWIGYNSRMYDQYIFKGILLGMNPYEISDKLINQDINGYNAVPESKSIPFNNFDISTGFQGLKQLEGFMGSKIKESDVEFNIERQLTQKELDEVILYCTHDVEQTIRVFENRREEFDSQLAMIDAFELDMSMFNKTKAQLSAHVLGAFNKKKYDDEFDLAIPDTLSLNKYKYILDWYNDKKNRNYNKKLITNVANVSHIFAWGGIHGAIPNYIGEGDYVMSDIASMYPALMIEYNFISRNVENPEKYREIRDRRIIMKKNKDPRQLPMKIVLNSTYGAMKDKNNNLYDPRNANNVCIAGQLLILDLIEKIEPYCELVQSNTDGILVKFENSEMKKKYMEECEKWSKRSRLDLEHDEYVKVIQKDVNNYIIVDKNGKYKSKGGYVKKLKTIDYDLPIINKALIEYFTKNISIEDTINNCDDLIEYQKIVKVSKLYKYAVHNDIKIKEKVLRVFASKDENDSAVCKIKSESRIEKIANTPDHCFIYNDEVTNRKIPEKLDKQYYIDIANKRLSDFLSKNKKISTKLKSDIKGVNQESKEIMEQLIENNDDLFDFLQEFKNSSLNKKTLETMTKLNYMSKYGDSNKLLRFYTYYFFILNKKSFKITTLREKLDDEWLISNIKKHSQLNKNKTAYEKFNYEECALEIWDTMLYNQATLYEIIKNEIELTGEVLFVDDKYSSKVFTVCELDVLKTITNLTLHCVKTGEQVKVKLWTSQYNENPFEIADILYLEENYITKKPQKEPTGEINPKTGKKMYRDVPNKFELWLIKWRNVTYEFKDK